MRMSLIALACALSSPAWALCDVNPADPKAGCEKPGKLDPRMVTAAYEPGQVYVVHVAQGQTLAVTISPDETAMDGFGADKTLLRADISGNVVLLETGPAPVGPRPLFIRSRSVNGVQSRTYTLLADSRPAEEAMVGFTFTYPADDAARRSAAWRQVVAQREQAAAAAALAADAGAADRNKHYVLQGETAADWDLLPTRRVSDDGTDTRFWFPGNMRVPIIYAITPDGKEAVVDPTFNSKTGIATVHQLGRVWHLKDGDALLCVFNRAYDPIGVRSGTGTASASVERVTR